jgi:hypothetical protein
MLASTSAPSRAAQPVRRSAGARPRVCTPAARFVGAGRSPISGPARAPAAAARRQFAAGNTPVYQRPAGGVVAAASGNGTSSADVYDTVIVGAGISGLVTAQALATKHADAVGSFLVTEARERVGGNITSMAGDGYVWEEGPNSFQPNDSMLMAAVSCGVVNGGGTGGGGQRRGRGGDSRDDDGERAEHSSAALHPLLTTVPRRPVPPLPAFRWTPALRTSWCLVTPPRRALCSGRRSCGPHPAVPTLSRLTSCRFGARSARDSAQSASPTAACRVSLQRRPRRQRRGGGRHRCDAPAAGRAVMGQMAWRHALPGCMPEAGGWCRLPPLPHPPCRHCSRAPCRCRACRPGGERGAVHPAQPRRRGV